MPAVLDETGSETEPISRDEIFANVMPADSVRLATSRNLGKKASKAGNNTEIPRVFVQKLEDYLTKNAEIGP